MLIPCGTDAPIYHFPFATIGLIVINAVVFVMQCVHGFEAYDAYMLHYGTLNPLQWVTNNFLHGDILHLLGNMVFLGVFGLIVEGKVGWLRFLTIYLACGTISGMTIQVLSAGATGKALGASDAIFAIMAVALFWAPENEIEMLFYVYRLPYQFELSVLECSGFYLLQNFAVSALTGFSLTGATAHLVGAFFGAVVGYFTLSKNMVDCEGFDLLSVIQGRRGLPRPLTASQQAAESQARKQRQQARKDEIKAGLERVEQYIHAGHFEMAEARFAAVKALDAKQVMPAAWRRAIIKHLLSDESMAPKAAVMMDEYLGTYSEARVEVTLALAKLLVTHLSQPGRAVQCLNQLDAELTPDQQALASKIYKRAEQLLSG